ncbi:MAG: glycosyltransferase [Butyrivibrio sp.]|nr:glycosyltransferase [Butyrivibrio sp.]
MAQNKLISVIVPVYNAGRYLDRSIESLLEQTYKNIEIIMVNDSSTDNSETIIRKYAELDSRIVLLNKNNEGAGAARNYGISHANGELIAFCDADDFVEHDMYEKLLDAMQAKNYDIACCLNTNENTNVNITGETKEFYGDDLWNLMIGQIGTKPSDASDIVYGSGVWQCLFRKQIILDNGISFKSEREIASEDLLFNIEYISKCKNAVYLQDELYHHCDNFTSMSHGRHYYKIENEFRLFEALEDFLNSSNKTEYSLEMQRFLIKRIRNQIISISKGATIQTIISDLLLIRKVLNNRMFRDNIDDYPGYLLPIKQRIMFYCMKLRLSILCFVLCLAS